MSGGLREEEPVSTVPDRIKGSVNDEKSVRSIHEVGSRCCRCEATKEVGRTTGRRPE